MNIIQDFIPIGRRNRPGIVNPMRFITIHNTGNPERGANARAHANFLKSDDAANAPTSWHYTVDDREIFQHIPDNETAFHAGDGAGPGNRQSIGIEICMNIDGDLLKATNNAVELTALLCKRHNTPVESIVQHNHWSGKNCPSEIRAGRPYNWNTFLNKVRDAMKGGSDEVTQDQFNAMMDEWLRQRAALPESAWSFKEGAFKALTEQGIMNGERPRAFITREELAAVIERSI